MVWNSAGSTLYKAVEQHNSSSSVCEAEHSEPPENEHCDEAERHCPRCEPPHCQKCSCIAQHRGLEALLQDKDFVLLAGLMLLLMHEKADSKLILALAFVLFG